MRALLLSALLTTAAAAQTAPASRCDAGDPMPTPFPTEPGAAETERALSDPEPVAMPNLCDATAGPRVILDGPLSMSTRDRLRQRYDVFRERAAPDARLRLDPLAPGHVRILRDVEPYDLGDRWIPYPDLHTPDRLIVRPDLFPQGTPDLPPVALPAERE